MKLNDVISEQIQNAFGDLWKEKIVTIYKELEKLVKQNIKTFS
jgi:DNA-binding PadR family transcriptional regulator